MPGYTLRKSIDWVLGKVQLVTGFAVVAFGASLKAEVSVWQARWRPLGDLLALMQSGAWIVVIAGPLIVGLAALGRRQFGSPWAWEALQKVLTEFRNEVFDDCEEDPLDFHRATLFRYRALWWRWPPTRWLVPVARSDHLTQRGISSFRVPDQADDAKGVVGLAWRCRDWVIVPQAGQSLPNIDASSTEESVREYAAQTKVSVDWVKEKVAIRKPLAGSYAALLVRVRGRPWGVLVLDSRSRDPIPKKKLERYRAYGSLLTPLLERA